MQHVIEEFAPSVAVADPNTSLMSAGRLRDVGAALTRLIDSLTETSRNSSALRADDPVGYGADPPRRSRGSGTGLLFGVHSLAHPVFDESGELAEYVGTLVDLTDRKRVEEELRRSEAYLAEGQRLTRTGSWGWNVTTGEVYWSLEQFRTFERDPEQVRRRSKKPFF